MVETCIVENSIREVILVSVEVVALVVRIDLRRRINVDTTDNVSPLFIYLLVDMITQFRNEGIERESVGASSEVDKRSIVRVRYHHNRFRDTSMRAIV